MRGTLSVPDRGPAVTGATVRLPPGLLAHIGDVAECPEGAAAAGQCGDDTRIGAIGSSAGRSRTRHAHGSLYIVPRAPGAVAGLAAVVDVRLGELDLGRLVLSGQFILRPTDAGLDLQLGVPTTFAGLGLHFREAALVIDRALFAVNPSTCGPLPYFGTFTGAGGATGDVGGAITYDGCCGALPFAPTLTAASAARSVRSATPT